MSTAQPGRAQKPRFKALRRRGVEAALLLGANAVPRGRLEALVQLCQPLLALARSRSHLVSPPAPRLGSLLPASAKSLPREQTGAGPARAPLPALLFLCYFFFILFFFFLPLLRPGIYRTKPLRPCLPLGVMRGCGEQPQKAPGVFFFNQFGEQKGERGQARAKPN